MSRFQQPVGDYMTREVEAVLPTTTLPGVASSIERLGVSALPVVEHGTLIGVVSRADLLHVGRLHALGGRRPGTRTLVVPETMRVAEIMKPAPYTVTPGAHLSAAARIMQKGQVHRVFVVEHGHVVGVLTTLDLAAAVRDARLDDPLEAVMSSPIYSVRTSDPLSLATARLEHAHVTGLIVVEPDDDWPVGVFTQVEALAARDLPRDAQVEDVFDQSVICMPRSARLFRAAAHAARLDVRRVVVCHRHEAIGVIGGLDFARVVATA